VDQLQEASRTMLTQYVTIEGSALGQLIRTGVESTDWLNRKEPSDIDAVRFAITIYQHSQILTRYSL